MGVCWRANLKSYRVQRSIVPCRQCSTGTTVFKLVCSAQTPLVLSNCGLRTSHTRPNGRKSLFAVFCNEEFAQDIFTPFVREFSECFGLMLGLGLGFGFDKKKASSVVDIIDQCGEMCYYWSAVACVRQLVRPARKLAKGDSR